MKTKNKTAKMGNVDFKYFAFISYSSKDTEWGKRLQKKLEHYRMPATLCSKRGWERKPIKPVFFAPMDIQPGELTEELQERLRASRNLIVICSPYSAKSEWVGKEIEYFHKLGRTKQIQFFIIDGVPHSEDPDTECFNKVTEELGLPEILGANIHERVFRWSWLNRERAYVQLISKLLGVEFDIIWQRHRRLLIQKAVGWCIALLAVAAALFYVWRTNQPTDVNITLNETTPKNEYLPPLKDAVISMTLDNESKTDTIRSLENNVLTFRNVPQRFLNKSVRITAACPDFITLDTMLVLKKDMALKINRKPEIYGNIHFVLFKVSTEKTLPNTKVNIEGREYTSDADGMVDCQIPIEAQKMVYHVSIAPPHKLVCDSLFMPCSESTSLAVE